MSSHREAICRLCRVERTKLFLKGAKCLSAKCPVEKRAYPPGEHGRDRRRILGYGIQLREKQKIKRYYGMSEKQFRLFFVRADRKKGITGENLLSMLERRLDNVIFLIGFGHSRGHARQLITHGHFAINGRKATIPSMLVGKGDVISFREKAKENEDFKAIVKESQGKQVPGWIQVDSAALQAKILTFPTRQDIPIPVEEHLVVELYSK
ncbi:MAG: 30S ribosomal protein S4 [Acidobacteria bacterium]|nr:30S ribosomal protein S4 [Acidobacteriota bacterium]MBU4255249.1 30S ribosomal protein S4 [Acidobacteriota bacterium]MBU4329783.1 30S ribosomal protein S4 [Acidobacteriota bacterium]MBU4494838.1 30S ribosomal protein S4 [Acidobacteriota bacterium]MCG2815974.1 30S ribosomal protein S4 [Candidatus Aminicenantes bacterium]